ncbi:MAG: glycosyltransferase family 4 protein, partial [Akkermansiaceae bacterium]|nr:glycosyltransferase family 4 protein [Akkermansiaceae bacterium]
MPRTLLLDPGAAWRQIVDRLVHPGKPNGSWFFILGALRFLRRHLRTERYDAVLSTSPDLAAHRIASEVSVRYGIPWVADSRDDFATIRRKPAVFLKLEKRYLEPAAAFTTVSHGVAEALEERLGRPVSVIENGF